MHPFLCSISFFFIFLLLIFNLPLSTSQPEVEVDFRFSNCSHDFDCGTLKDIGYPFWGRSRPEYCGHPEFKLECPENDHPVITIIDRKYRVLEINENNRTLHIARTDSWNGDCPVGPMFNTTIDTRLFTYPTPVTRSLTLAFGCSVLGREVGGKDFTCNINGNPMVGFSSWSDPASLYPKLLGCSTAITIPVLSTAVSPNPNVEDVLKQGFQVQYDVDAEECKECEKSDGQCGFNRTTSDLQCFCRHGPNKRTWSRGNKPKKVIIAAIVAGTLFTVATIAIVFCYLRRKPNTSIVMWERKTKKCAKVEAFLKDCELLELKRCKYKDIKKMTNSFKHKIGQGGYGSVFKGQLHDRKAVAVKVLSESKGNGNEFINEVAAIARTSHVNIVTLLGFCIEGTKRALIYEFMPNGSLEKFIYNKITLEPHFQFGWEKLYKIAIGIARGLEYLHRGCNKQILHFDIKPHNILLDEDFAPKIADFGLSKLYNVKESLVSMTGARGTPGYIAPELFSRNFGGVSHKADVYSYGMMILEMVGGRKNIDVTVTNISEIYFPHWIYKRLDLNEDLGLHGITTVEDQEIAQKMVLVGLWCIQMDPLDRPTMSKVLDMLRGSLDALQIPPKPFFLTSPSRKEDPCTNMSNM